MNPQRDRGMRAERAACKLLSELGGWNVQRMANQGIREDIGDLIGVPDTTIQVSAVPKTPAVIWARARAKALDCAQQQDRHGMTHGVVLLHIDGGTWRAIVSDEQLEALGGHRANTVTADVTPGSIIHWAPHWACGWEPCGAGLWVNGIKWWAVDIANATRAVA